jgi:hypothetical protein
MDLFAFAEAQRDAGMLQAAEHADESSITGRIAPTASWWPTPRRIATSSPKT